MILDPAQLSPGAVYHFMIGVIVPRPIAFISTTGRSGSNLAPFSYFLPITNRPPLIGISINARAGEPKDTLRNIRDTGEFVINIVTESFAEHMVRSSGEWPEDIDEFSLAGLTPLPSERVKAPRLAESPVNLECRRYREIELGDSAFVVGELLLAHVDDTLLTDGHVDPVKLRPLGRLGGDGYMPLREVIHLARPKVRREGGGGGA